MGKQFVRKFPISSKKRVFVCNEDNHNQPEVIEGILSETGMGYTETWDDLIRV